MWFLRKMGISDSRYLSNLSPDTSDSESDFSTDLENMKEPESNLRNAEVPTMFSRQSNLNFPESEGGDLEKVNNMDAAIQAHSNCMEPDLTMDAAIKTNVGFPRPEQVLSLDQLPDIEKMLDKNEMVSLVYLLYDEPHYALQELDIWLNHDIHRRLLFSWAVRQKKGEWQNKLVEALCIIKNYEILKTLGYKKTDLTCYYLPQHPCTISLINRTRKAIYLICEKLNIAKTKTFIDSVRSSFMKTNLSFKEEYDYQYLELYFLEWESIQYITKTDVSHIKYILKIMDEESLYNILNEISLPKKNVNTKNSVMMMTPKRNTIASDVTKVSKTRKTSTSVDNTLYSGSSQFTGDDTDNSEISPISMGQDHANATGGSCDDNSRYLIDPENPGVTLIINQENFFTEIDAKYQPLLPVDTKYMLETRMGTEKDKDDLANMFEKFGYRVIIKNNLSHLDMIKTIREVVSSIRDESSLFVCILSHGDKGIVYGANSCRVKVSEIQETICKINKTHLVDKPKILILQSCQGTQCQKMDENSDEDESLTTDGSGSSRHAIPKTADILTFWATVPGFAAIRNKKTGSWFIQSLCTKMEQLGNRHHFADICTRIKSEVTAKTWTLPGCDKNVMVPMVVTTLRKDFYLPPIRRS